MLTVASRRTNLQRAHFPLCGHVIPSTMLIPEPWGVWQRPLAHQRSCHRHTKYRQTPLPQESRSKHERDYDCCWATQHAIDVQAHAIHDDNVINYIFLFDRKAGVSDVCGWMSL